MQSRRRLSNYGIQLREKRKTRVIYGVLERQFRGYYKEARSNPNATGFVLMQLLERRLDNVVYRLDFAESRSQARQMVMHGHFVVNGKKVDIPSFRVTAGDEISWKPSSLDSDSVKTLLGGIPRKAVPNWLSLEIGTSEGKIIRLPEAEEIDTNVEPRMIVEFYSK